MENKQPVKLRFNGSLWCNLDIAQRVIDKQFRHLVRPAVLTVLEWYILQSLFQRDGQRASELANSVGRPATSFTPSLSKLEDKGLVIRKPDGADRRAVRIQLTAEARRMRAEVIESAREIDARFSALFDEGDYAAFLRVLFTLQNLSPDELL